MNVESLMVVNYNVRAVLIVAVLLAPAAWSQTAPPVVKATVDVVSVTPVDGVGIDADKYPGDVHVLTPAKGKTVAQSLGDRAASVDTSEALSNRYQPDIAFRGFVASPLLGTPQGVAVFQDGVRVNEPFGDVVNWDTLSEDLASIQIIPGSNAAFGLNALGGVVALRTKTGFSDPGTSAEVGAGAFGWRRAEVSSGWSRGGAGYFLGASHEEEHGWRDFSPSRLDHLFGSAQWARARRSSDIRITLAETSLTGNGSVPVQLLDADRSAVFTHPDSSRNRAILVSTAHDLSAPIGNIEFNGSLRHSSLMTRNGDESPFHLCGDILCDESDAPVVDQSGAIVHPTQSHPLNAVLNRSDTSQTALALTAQLRRSATILARENNLLTGVAVDYGRASFASDAQLADMTNTRGAISTDQIAESSIVNVDTRITTTSAYVTDVVTLSPSLTASLAARLNHSAIDLIDRHGDDLSGDHRFTNVNPSIGFAWAFRVATLFGSISQASRTPTPVELTCANADDPCRLPNAFVADPPLRQVSARTGEIGIRGRGTNHWSIAAFRSANRDDIIFISSGALRGEGFFSNIGTTQRQGFEASIESRAGKRFEWYANESFVDATFQSGFSATSPHHPTVAGGVLAVRPGDRMPLIPRNTIKAGLTWRRLKSTTFSTEARYVSSAFFRGDEANLATPLPAYAVADVAISRSLTSKLSMQLAVRNIANARYATFGTYGDARNVLGPVFDDPRFVAPGEPRTVQLSLDFRR